MIMAGDGVICGLSSDWPGDAISLSFGVVNDRRREPRSGTLLPTSPVHVTDRHLNP